MYGCVSLSPRWICEDACKDDEVAKGEHDTTSRRINCIVLCTVERCLPTVGKVVVAQANVVDDLHQQGLDVIICDLLCANSLGR